MSRPTVGYSDKPNIVLVMTDQHAARALGCAGDPAAQTPALDALAARGTRFTNAYCPAPLCVPSRMAFLTGLEPHVSGVLSNDDFLPSDIPTIAHALGAAGYDTRLIGRMHFYGPDQHHGFADRPIGDIGPGWPGAGAPAIGPLTDARGNRGPELPGSGIGETSYQAYDHAVTETAERELEEMLARRDGRGTPFFALVSLFCPHPPYIAAPDDYHAVAPHVGPPRLSAPPARHPALAEWAEAGGVDAVPQDAAMRSRTAYYGLVRMIDRLAGRVLRRVEGRDDTIVIYLSDHGEALGERGLWWKSTFHDDSAKVPLIMAGPGIEAGTEDDRVTSLLDFSATLLARAGAPALPGHAGRDLSLREGWENSATSSYYGGLMNIRIGSQRHRMLRAGRYKLCWYDGHAPQLFDLEDDPDELSDLSHARPDLVMELGVELRRGWNPNAIAQAQAISQQRNAILRSWVGATRPPERLRWRDPRPERNRYLD
ncbi:sulfatase-like hydrolase/transferase [Vannielia sp. SX4]|uniref:sulfatase-like hydrolase/transferase n=1 Tax=Vannielia sp. SX4 TaxID=3463852 RepID=UPI00405A1810